jgi:hypothetical protein
MVTRKARGKGAPAKATAGKHAARPTAKKATPAKKSARKAAVKPPPSRKPAAKGSSRPARPVAAPSKAAAVKSVARPAASSEQVERPRAVQHEKTELQELLGQARAELDSALAESAQLRDRLRTREAEESRGTARQEEPAGPGEFDPAVDLDDDIPSMNEDDLEGAAGFFDRMDEIRARRNELDRERTDRELEQSEQSFWMICPKCGDLMEEQESENVKLERCENCGGLFLDRGEVDLLLTLSSGPEGMRRLHNMLKF